MQFIVTTRDDQDSVFTVEVCNGPDTVTHIVEYSRYYALRDFCARHGVCTMRENSRDLDGNQTVYTTVHLYELGVV